MVNPAHPDDLHFMRLALDLARRARDAAEVPVGAVVVSGGRVIGQGSNRVITGSDPSAHAEICALRDAASRTRNYRLADATVYVTLEPCPMCAGAMVHARVNRLVFGAPDPKAGAAGSVFRITDHPQLNHRIAVAPMVLWEEAALLLTEFFRERRGVTHIPSGAPETDDSL